MSYETFVEEVLIPYLKNYASQIKNYIYNRARKGYEKKYAKDCGIDEKEFFCDTEFLKIAQCFLN